MLSTYTRRLPYFLSSLLIFIIQDGDKLFLLHFERNKSDDLDEIGETDIEVEEYIENEGYIESEEYIEAEEYTEEDAEEEANEENPDSN